MVEQKRNYGIDLLRIVSMIMIVTLHTLSYGGFLKGGGLTVKYGVMWFLETVSYCAVNCYALISGYVGFGKRFRLSAIMQLWLEVVFYQAVICLALMIAEPSSVSGGGFVTSFFPVLSDKYWYFTAYFAMFFFTPFINRAVESLSFEANSSLLSALICVFSLLPTLGKIKRLSDDTTVVNNGYSPLWLIILYFIGAYIKKYGLAEKITRKTAVSVYLCCLTVTFASKLAMKQMLLKYNSPTVLLCAAALFVLFVRIDVSEAAARVIAFFSSATFGVYLIHMHGVGRRILREVFTPYAEKEWPEALTAVICGVLTVWFVCSVADKGRQALFGLLRIKPLTGKAEKKLMKAGDSIMRRYTDRIM